MVKSNRVSFCYYVKDEVVFKFYQYIKSNTKIDKSILTKVGSRALAILLQSHQPSMGGKHSNNQKYPYCQILR